MRTLGPEDIDQLITITGMVTRASDLIPEMAEAVFRCSVCRYTVTAELERGRIHEPTLCQHCSTNHSFSLVHNRSRYQHNISNARILKVDNLALYSKISAQTCYE